LQIILLAAGQSKRVNPIEDKNFIKFCGKYLIEWQLETLKQAKFEDILIICNELNLEKIKIFVKNSKNKNLAKNIKFGLQKNLDLGMAGAILDNQSLIKKDVIIISSNDVVDLKAYGLIKEASKKEKSAMIGYQISKYFPGGYLQIDKKGYITEIIEKPKQGKEPSNMINIVIHYFADSQNLVKKLKEEIKNKSKDDIYERSIQNLINDGLKVKAIPYKGFWQAVKFPWHVFQLQKYFFKQTNKHISRKTSIAKTAIINGDVIIEDGVKIFDNAIIQGPCYIGKNSIIANNALVRNSNIGENCVIGFATEIARSHLGNDVWTHTNYIGDSIIGNNVSFGSGTVTGNLRLDEKNIKCGDFDTNLNKFGLLTGDNIRCGINVSFMPGIKIGSDSMIGAGITVIQDIEKNSFVRGEIKLKISENKMKIRNEREGMKKMMNNSRL